MAQCAWQCYSVVLTAGSVCPAIVHFTSDISQRGCCLIVYNVILYNVVYFILFGCQGEWDAVVRAYERDSIFLGEAAQLLVHNTNYDMYAIEWDEMK